MTNSGKSMSNSYGRDVTLEFAHHDTDRLLGLGVQSTCGLVEQEHLETGRDRLADLHDEACRRIERASRSAGIEGAVAGHVLEACHGPVLEIPPAWTGTARHTGCKVLSDGQVRHQRGFLPNDRETEAAGQAG